MNLLVCVLNNIAKIECIKINSIDYDQ